MRSPGYVGECIFWPSLNDSEKFLTISIFPGAIGGRFGQEHAFWPLPRASLSNDDNGQLVMRVMMTTTTKMTMTMVIVMMITITKIARDYVEVPLLWSLPWACSVLSQDIWWLQVRPESSSKSRSGILLPSPLTSLRRFGGSKLPQKGRTNNFNLWIFSFIFEGLLLPS